MRKALFSVVAALLAVPLFGASAMERPSLLQAAAMEPPVGAMLMTQASVPEPQELARRVQDGRWIMLRTGSFDPLVTETKRRPVSPLRAAVHTGGEYVLAQFTDDLSKADWKALEGRGARVLTYIPSHTYIIRVAGDEALAAVRQHSRYRWDGPYVGDYKLNPLLSSNDWSLAVFVDTQLFPGENPLLVLSHFQGLDPDVAGAAIHGTMEEGATLRLFIPEGHLHPFIENASEEPGVQSMDPWFLPHIMNDNSVWVIQSYDTTNRTNYALSATIWNHGITGTGQIPAISDTGCDDDMCYFRYSSAAADITDADATIPPALGTTYPAKKVFAYWVVPGATSYDGNNPCNGTPETEHGTHTSGTIVGDNFATLSTPTSGGHDTGDGMAPNAKLFFQDIGNEVSGCLDGLSYDNYLIYQQAYDGGARLHSNSWGSDTGGLYTSDCRTVDRFIYNHEDFQFFFANGNAGSGAMTVGSPAAAKDCVSVGALANGSAGANTIASFSSRGPTADGRIKPDVSAPGSSVRSASGSASHTDNNCGNKTLSGTSMATPTVAGGATLLRQYFTDGFYPGGAANAAESVNPSAALIKAALVNGAVDISPTTQAAIFSTLTPNNNQGFGRALLDTVLFFSTPSRDTRRVRVWDKFNAGGLSTSQIDSFPLQVAAGQPLKVTLAWTDPEASTVAGVTLVNNLDLEVVAPDGITSYKGNVFLFGQSTTGGSADNLNNVEEVFVISPVAGTWTLRVKAVAVPGTPSEPSSVRQGYALVATYADCVTSLAAPATMSATDNGTTGIDLSWGAVPGAARYQVYRASGTCAAAVSDFHYLGQTTGTTFTDATPQGGLTYAYRVRAADDCAEGSFSACDTATFTGNCTLAPTFDGLLSAANDTTTVACDVLLSWDAGSSNCPQSPGISYNVFRGTSPYFTVDGSSLLAAGLTGTSYRDSAVDPNVTYYYVVRSEDSSTVNGGFANGGNQDQNTSMFSATPTAPTYSNGTWSDAGGDGAAYLVMQPPWRVTNQQNHTAGGTFSYHSAADGQNYPSLTCAAATTPVIPLQAGTSPVLTFWDRYNVEYQFDGIVVEISVDGGAFSQLALVPNYPNTFAQTGNPPINQCLYASSVRAFTGPSNQILTAWASETADLTAYAGHNVQIRWRLSTDPGAEFEGFYLDDISITNAGTPDNCGTCPNAPSAVSITPGGPLTLCPGTSQLLTAGVTGGTGPFTYQWTRDGVDIPGAMSSTYTANDSGSHFYNCKVTGDGCADPRTATTPTQISWQAYPFFGGATSVTTPFTATCALEVSWSPATAVCGGTVTYNVYRSSIYPFIPSPATWYAAGVTGSSYTDSANLTSGLTYYYIVRAVDSSNGAEDPNNVVQSGVPLGPLADSTFLDDAGDTTSPRMTMDAPWSLLATGGKTGPRVYATGTYTNNSCRALTTPILQLATGAQLSFASKYSIAAGDAGILQVSTAPTFTNWTKLDIVTYPNALATAGNNCGFPVSGANTVFSQVIGTPAYPAASYTADLSAYDGQQVRVRWVLSTNASGTSTGWWVDDVAITHVMLPTACATGAPGTAPAITSAATTTFLVGTPNAFTVTTTGSPVPSLSMIGSLPAGVTFVDNGDGTGTLGGTPAAGTAGTYNVTFQASNGVPPVAVQSFTLLVSDYVGAPVTARIWLGLKNSDDVGTHFDVKAEVRKNGALIGTGEIDNVSGGSSGFNNAALRAIAVALSAPVLVTGGDTLSLTLSVRIGATGHRSGTARLWYNDTAANSRLDVTYSGVATSHYLRDGFLLEPTAAPVTSTSKKTIDVFVDRLVGGNAFKSFGTWTKTF